MDTYSLQCSGIAAVPSRWFPPPRRAVPKRLKSKGGNFLMLSLVWQGRTGLLGSTFVSHFSVTFVLSHGEVSHPPVCQEGEHIGEAEEGW